MKILIIFSIIFFRFCSVYSQDLIKELQKLTLENDSLKKQVIRPLQDSILKLNITNATEVSKLQKQINTLEKEKDDLNKKTKDFEKDIIALNKNQVKIERDSLQKQVVQLNANIVDLNHQNQDKDWRIAEEKRICEQKAKAENEKGKYEALEDVVNSYKNKRFDDLILSSSKLSILRDMQLVGNNAEVKQILFDLEKYFNAEELLAKKFDSEQLQKVQVQLNQIKQQSTLLAKLKENVEYYKGFYDELRKTIEKLVDLDKNKTAVDEKSQILKFNIIVSELTNYIYNYYSYGNYPYLSDIVLEIIKRKKPNANADIMDLLSKVQ